MEQQTQDLAKEWNGKLGDMLNSEYVLKGTTLLAEVFNGNVYSRIHKRPGGHLIIEERKKGEMYATSWELIQDFSDMESEFEKFKANGIN